MVWSSARNLAATVALHCTPTPENWGSETGRGGGLSKSKKMTHSFTDPKTPNTTGVYGHHAVVDLVGVKTREPRAVQAAAVSLQRD